MVKKMRIFFSGFSLQDGLKFFEIQEVK